MKVFKFLLVMIAMSVSGITKADALSTTKITNLKVEYASMPLGIDVEQPRFSWQMETDGSVRGCRQKAYSIVVTAGDGTVAWNSGRVCSDDETGIRYHGLQLQPCTRYRWQLNVWDHRGETAMASSWFETGLMTHRHAGNAFGDAKWIGADDTQNVLYSHYLPMFRLDFTFQFDEKSKSHTAAFIYGANDERLMDSNKNLFHHASPKDSSYIKVEISTAPLDKGRNAVIDIYRTGYEQADKHFSFEIPSQLINSSNRYMAHRLQLASNLGKTSFYIDGESKPAATILLNPLGQGGDFIAYPMLADIGYDIPKGQKINFSDIFVRNYRSPAATIAEIRTLEGSYTGGQRRIINPSQNAMPMLRTTFSIDRKIARARLYVTARGIYEMYVNGKRIGNDYFNPGYTQYNRTLMYQTYDITPQIQEGGNAVGAILAEGWWSGGATYTGENWNYFGDRLSLQAKLVITYTDGTTKTIVTQPDTWRCYSHGPIVYGSIFQGEVYDAAQEPHTDGWNRAGYDDAAWSKATEVSLDGHVSHEGWGNGPRADDYTHFHLIAQYGQTVKAVAEVKAQSMEQVRPGVFVYDMGQNMVGVPHIAFPALQRGQRVTLRFAEVKYPDLPEYKDNTGMIMLENIRAAMAQDIYIARGEGSEQYSPRFTYHGYRYIEITGIGKPIPVDSVRGIVLSSLDHVTADYKTSDEKVNRLWDNILWSARGNFFSVPTDCPQRNERLGWAGDISVFSRTATYLAALPQFLRRYLRAMRDVQRADGRFPDIAPLGGGFGGMLWGAAGITVTWESYQQYADTLLLQEQYDAMKRYIRFILDKMIDPATGIIVQTKTWEDLDDWLGPENKRNDKSLLWESYFIYELDIMHRIAVILRNDSDAAMYARLRDERKSFFMRTYVDAATGETIGSGFSHDKGALVDTQTSYVLPLAFGIPDGDMKKKMAAQLVKTIKRSHTSDDGKSCPPYSLMTGFIGTAWISKALTDNGYADIAYRLLLQEEYPSWLYPVNQGATTIWERLNSYTRNDGFGGNNRMNSFNHYSFGAIGAWLQNYSLGIMRDESSPGFKHFILRPVVDPTGRITSASGHYDSMYGRISSAWHHDGAKSTYTFSIPANSSATLYLDAASWQDITESGKSIGRHARGIARINREGNTFVMELESGNYTFDVKARMK
jgi:alpha-L-rhamnosidase